MLNELNRFENELKQYIFLEINKNQSTYHDNAEYLIKRILNNDAISCYILSFNYTLPRIKTINAKGTNVHGYIGEHQHDIRNEIIIGFDQWVDSNLESNRNNDLDNTYIFTKTYRKIINSCTLISQKLPSKDSVTNLVLYGHSLGLSDYSYFFSLFDLYEIYNGKVIIEFAYSIYDETLKFDIISNVKRSITKLIQTYGRTMENKDHGQNLLHKLILEQRLIVRSID